MSSNCAIRAGLDNKLRKIIENDRKYYSLSIIFLKTKIFAIAQWNYTSAKLQIPFFWQFDRKIGNPKICLFNCFANTQEPPKEVYFFWSPCILKCFMLTFPIASIISKKKLWLSCAKLSKAIANYSLVVAANYAVNLSLSVV